MKESFDEQVIRFQNGWICPECGLQRTDGVDPCIGRLPSVKFACCGHGGRVNGSGYIYFENGTIIYFDHINEVKNVP